MAKKKTTANYHMGDLVVVKTTGWDKTDIKYEVGMITNVRYATQLTKKTYDVRTEAGSGMIQLSVDNKKSNQTIISSITEAWIANGGTNNMFIHKKHGHTRANYASDIKLRADGEDMDSESLTLGHYEKYNNFVFPTQGPRSF